MTPAQADGGVSRLLLDEDELLLLADAQTSGGLLVAGEVPGYPVVGELIERGPKALVVR
jgi:selenide,water dikinase